DVLRHALLIDTEGEHDGRFFYTDAAERIGSYGEVSGVEDRGRHNAGGDANRCAGSRHVSSLSVDGGGNEERGKKDNGQRVTHKFSPLQVHNEGMVQGPQAAGKDCTPAGTVTEELQIHVACCGI